MKLLEHKMIWDKAPHNAFTDLIRYKDYWYCAFREAGTHMSNDGVLRVIRSKNGKKWKSVATMKWDGGDVRDAKLSITPNDELMLNGAIRFTQPKDEIKIKSLTWFTSNGKNWSEPFFCETGINSWRWSTTWKDGFAYSIGYTNKDKLGCLYKSIDGKVWSEVKREFFPDSESYWNESSISFKKDKAYCLLRRDSGTYSSYLGVSKPPYIDWKWKDLGVPIGGPKIIHIKGKRKILACVRLYEQNSAHTSLCWIDVKKGKLEEALYLPSWGDTSYAGMQMHDGILWVSYYSSHEGKTSIYLAKVEI